MSLSLSCSVRDTGAVVFTVQLFGREAVKADCCVNSQPLPPHLFLFFLFLLFWVFFSPFYYLTGQSGDRRGDGGWHAANVSSLAFILAIFFAFWDTGVLTYPTMTSKLLSQANSDLEDWNWGFKQPKSRVACPQPVLHWGPSVVFLENTWSDTGRFLLSGEEAFYPVERVRPEIREEEYGGDELFWGGGRPETVLSL